MKKLILLAGAAMLAASGPVAAKPDAGHGQGHGQGGGKHVMMEKGHGYGAGKSRHGVHAGDRSGRVYAINARGNCPPGLAKKNNGCLPPGQAKKLYNAGQRYNANSGSIWSYNQIPDGLRSQYGLKQNDRYYYNSGYVYQVDPKTMLVRQAISAVLR